MKKSTFKRMTSSIPKKESKRFTQSVASESQRVPISGDIVKSNSIISERVSKERKGDFLSNYVKYLESHLKEFESSDKNFKTIFDSLFVNGELSRNIFLHGPGGTGKSHLMLYIKLKLDLAGYKTMLTSTTAKSALNIGGITIHSGIGIGIGNQDATTICKFMKDSRKSTLRSLNVLIIDEISMLPGELLQLIDEVLQKIRNKKKPMGGVITISLGDFLQLKPVQGCFAFETKTWENLKLQVFNFNTCKRFVDKDYFRILLQIRYGLCPKKTKEKLEERVKAYNRYKKTGNGISHSLVKMLTLIGSKSPIGSKKKNKSIPKIPTVILEHIASFLCGKIEPTFLFYKKMDVSRVNKAKLAEIESKEIVFKCRDEFMKKKYHGDDDFVLIKDNSISDEKKKNIEHLTDIPQKIILKIGAQVMLTKNLDLEEGLVNGAVGTIVKFTTLPNLDISVSVLFKKGKVEEIVMIGHQIEYTEDKVFIRWQIPLILSWAVTVHKIQGATIKNAIILSLRECPEALAYVALSRPESIDQLYLSDFNVNSIKADELAINFDVSIKETAIEIT